MSNIKRICIWSNPRNISTALMYSFAQRNDTQVVDEPLYAHYLSITGKDHPGAKEVLASQDNNGERVVKKVILGKYDKPVAVFKNMAHHFINLSPDFLDDVINVFLIRNPAQLIASYHQVIQNPTLSDIGLDKQMEIYQLIQNDKSIVLDSGELLANPKKILKKFCEMVDLPFDQKMLTWKAGPRPEDGVWAKHWYANVHKSRGFAKQATSNRPFPPHLIDLLKEAQPIYNQFYNLAIKA